MENERQLREHFPLGMTSIGYLVMALTLITLGGWFQYRNFLSGIFITEYIMILLPVFIIGKIGQVNFKKALQLNPLSKKQVGIIILLAILFLPVVLFSNMVAVFLLSFGGHLVPSSIPAAKGGVMLAVHFFLIAISAGLCEEFFFRGMMLNAFTNRMKTKHAILFSAFLFGVFHFNMQNFFGPVVLGIIFGYMVNATKSIWAGVLAHATNNGVAVISSYLASQGGRIENDKSLADALPSEYIPFLIFLGGISILSLFIIWKLFPKIKSCPSLETEETFFEMMPSPSKPAREGFRWYELLPIVAVCAIYLMYMKSMLFS